MAFFNFPFHIAKDKPAVANEVQANFDALYAWISDNLVQTDGSLPATGPIVLPPGPPGAPDHAANKAYVDAVVPVGTIWEFGGAVLPPKWLWANGATYTNTSQPLLAAALGRAHTAAGVPADSFQVPDRRKRMGIGVDAGEPAVFALGLKGGQRNSELQVHAHTVPIHGHGASSGTDTPDHAHGISFMSGASDRSLAHQHHMQHTHPGTGFNSSQGAGFRGAPWNAGGWGAGADSGALGGWYNTPPTGNADRDWTGAEGAPDHLHAINGGTGGANARHAHAVTVNNAAAFNTTDSGAGTTLVDKNLPPYIVLNYIIYAGA